MILGSGLAPVSELRAAGVPVGLGCDGSASADSASLWQEARLALLQGRLRAGQAGTPPGSVGAREVLEMATRGGAACLGREGELGQLAAGAAGDLVAWRLDGLAFSGAVSDPVEAWLRGGPASAWHTVIAGRPLIEAGDLTVAGLDGKLADHRRAAEAVQRPARGPSVPAGRGR
jgi:cytosine/adenosine deaminase-related metal-dependent hydrolase